MDTAQSPHIAPYIDRIRAAMADGTPLRLRGGGSKDFYGQGLTGELLSTRDLGGIMSYEPSELVVRVRTGTRLAEVEAALAEKGQCLPFEPPHFSENSTIGGMVAAGLSGPARATAGAVRDYILGVNLINGKGEFLSFGGQVMKNVAGYDVSRLMAGSLGTLGLMTDVSLKVLPVAPAETTLRFVLDEATALQKLNAWAGQPLPLNASSWVIDNGQPTLYLRLRGAVAAVESASQKLLAEVSGIRLDDAQTRADWVKARDLLLPWFAEGFARGDELWRLSVPQTSPALDVGNTFIEWLGGQRWVFVAAGNAEAATKIRAKAQAVGGSATLFVEPTGKHGANAQVFEALKAPLDRISRELKRQFDPALIFNRGRLYPDL
jgi:glycolate oxidase FAD binding subunit